MFRVQIRTFEHTLCVCVHVCVCVYQNTSGCGTAQLASAGLKPRCWSMCKNGSQQDAHEKKVKVFLTALFKKGYDCAIQIPRLPAKPLVTHTTYKHTFLCKKHHLTQHREGIYFISNEILH